MGEAAVIEVKKDEDVIANLILERRCKVIAEIGVWEGWMTKKLLQSCAVIEEYYSIDNWNILTHKDWRNWTEISKEEWDRKYILVSKMMLDFPQLRTIRFPSLSAVEIFPDHYFDLVYIDACHWYQDVIDDIEAWLPKVKTGGIIAGHDYGPQRDGTGRRSRCEVKQAVDDYFGENKIIKEAHEVWIKEL